MTVTFYALQDQGAEYEEVATVEDGEIVRGKNNIPAIRPEYLSDPQRLMERFDGPYLVASVESDSPTEKTHWVTEPRLGKVGWYDNNSGEFQYSGVHSAVRKFLTDGDTDALEYTQVSLVACESDTDNLLKQDSDSKWIPYKGPQEGEGWQKVGSGEVRYQQSPPGDVAEGHESDHWKQRWPEIEGSEWNEDPPSLIDMKDDDALLFVNRNGNSEVGRFESATFIRNEEWDSARMGVTLADGRQILEDDLVAHADMTMAVEPPDLKATNSGDIEWEDAPGTFNDYVPWNLVNFIDEDGEETVGIVEGYAESKNSLKVQTSEHFTVVNPNKITHYAETPREYNTGYEAIDSGFDSVPEVERTPEPPDSGFASRFGATTENIESAFTQIFGLHLESRLEDELESGNYDSDDPDDIVRAIVDIRGEDSDQTYQSFKAEARGRAVGIGRHRAERIVEEAFGLDTPDPRYEIRDMMDRLDDPESWLENAAQFAAIEDDFVSLQKLQTAINDWSGSVPFSQTGNHGFDGQPTETVALSETATNAGISAGAMFISEWDDGDKAFVTRIRDKHTHHQRIDSEFMESSEEAERAMTGYGVQSAFVKDNESVQIPDHHYAQDAYFSVASAPDGAVLANDFMNTYQNEDLELPNGFPDNEIADRLGAEVDDVIEAFGQTVFPGWEDDDETDEIFDNDPNLNRENPKDWVAVAKQRYDNPKERIWNAFAESLGEETYQSPIEKNAFMDMAFGAVIAGNRDLHVNNVMADKEGTIYPIDLDFSGYDMTTSHELSMAIGKLASTAKSLGIEASEEFQEQGDPNAFDDSETPIGQEILAHVNDTADSDTVETARDGNPMWNDGGADNVARNAEAAKNGELEL